jgi:hypothetical protein
MTEPTTLPVADDVSEVHLSTPLVRVTLDDGRVLTVQVRNTEYLRWDRTAAKHGWPRMQQAPFLWITFVAWAALRREGRIPADWTWEAFSDVHCLEVTPAAPDGNGSSPNADPTLPVPDPD